MTISHQVQFHDRDNPTCDCLRLCTVLLCILATDAMFHKQPSTVLGTPGGMYNLQFRHLADVLNPERHTMARYVGKKK